MRSFVLAAAAALGAGVAQAAHVHHAPASAAAHRLASASRSNTDDPSYELTFHLASPGLDQLNDDVHAIARNTSQHAQWLTHEQIQQRLAPHQNHTRAVKSWLQKHNVTDAHWSPHGDRVTFNATHSLVASTFKAPLTEYQVGSSRAFRAQSYTVPDDLPGVESITPLTSFLVPKPRHRVHKRYSHAQAAEALTSAQKHPQGCSDTFVTIDCLRQHYGSKNFKPVAKSNQTDLLIIGFGQDERLSHSDLNTFLKQFRSDQANATIQTQTYQADSATGSNSGSETMLDVEMAVGLIAPLNVEFLLSGFQGDDQFLKPLQQVLDSPNKPGVISVSYGPAESALTEDDAQRWHKTALALAAQGVTVVFASGDAGVDQDNKSCKKGLNPPWPTTDTILVVGGTTGTNPEHAMNPLTDPEQNVAVWSGAGWSNLNKAPSWQQNITKAYISHLPSNMTHYTNQTARAITDVSAQGEAIVTVINNTTQTVAGTSASAPIFASHLALVNSALRQKGQKNVGFIHPRLYEANGGGAVRDITHGETCGCPDVEVCFSSGAGWDPATGLGVPDFQGMLKFFGAT